MESWVPIALGLALVLVAQFDIVLTVLHIQVESPVSNRLNRALWWLLCGASRVLPLWPRDQLLAWGVPLMAISTIGFWALCSIVGFGLIYLPFVHDPAFVVTPDIDPRRRLFDALYLSGATFFTIGYGDVVPLHPLLRFAAVLEGGLGLLAISFSATYLLSVYPLIGRKIALAAALNQEMAGRSDGVVLARRYVPSGCFGVLAERLRSVNDELLWLGQAHSFYPLLFFARPREVHESFVRVLVLVQGAIGALRYGLDPSAHADVVDDPRLLVLEEGLLYTLHSLERLSVLARPGDDKTHDVRAEYAALLGELAANGLATRSADDPDALRAYARFRAATDPYVDAYAANLGYAPAAVRATFDRWARGSAPVTRSGQD